jgi:hypothetical protein
MGWRVNNILSIWITNLTILLSQEKVVEKDLQIKNWENN